jgi:hypothetical protein
MVWHEGCDLDGMQASSCFMSMALLVGNEGLPLPRQVRVPVCVKDRKGVCVWFHPDGFKGGVSKMSLFMHSGPSVSNCWVHRSIQVWFETAHTHVLLWLGASFYPGLVGLRQHTLTCCSGLFSTAGATCWWLLLLLLLQGLPVKVLNVLEGFLEVLAR